MATQMDYYKRRCSIEFAQTLDKLDGVSLEALVKLCTNAGLSESAAQATAASIHKLAIEAVERTHREAFRQGYLFCHKTLNEFMVVQDGMHGSSIASEAYTLTAYLKEDDDNLTDTEGDDK